MDIVICVQKWSRCWDTLISGDECLYRSVWYFRDVELYIQFVESAHMKNSLPGYQNVDDPQKKKNDPQASVIALLTIKYHSE